MGIIGGGGAICLDAPDLVGRGLHRNCYVHPRERDKCIKIVVAGDLVETRREKAYYRLLAGRNNSWRNLARYYGETETTAGRGAVFELIRDDNGAVSKTLQHYLESAHGNESIIDELTAATQELYTYMLTEKVITMTLKAKNICYQRKSKDASSGGRLVLVDNIGHSDFIPLCNHVDYLAVKKIRRRWLNFSQSILKTCENNPALNRAFRDFFASQDLC